MNIYVKQGEEQQGPYTVEQINRRLADGTYNPGDMALVEGG